MGDTREVLETTGVFALSKELGFKQVDGAQSKIG